MTERQSGWVKDARGATIEPYGGNRRFFERIAVLTKGDLSTPIALICATGVRSHAASRLLAARGYSQIYDVQGGMFGNPRQAGWLAAKLPIEPCTEC